MSRTTSFGPSVSIRPSNLARAVNVNTPSNYTQRPFSVTEQPHNTVSLGRTVNVNTPKPSPIKRAVNVNTPAPAATPKTSTPRPPFTSYRGGNISPVTGCPAGQISIAGTCVAIPTYSTPASNSPTAAMQTIRDKICAENPEACKPYPINERGLPITAKKLQSKYCEDHPDSELCKIGDRPVKTLPVTKPTPVAKPFANREEILKRTAEARKYCVEHPDTPVCKIIFNQPASPASEQPNNKPGTPANTNPPANVPDSSASG